MPDQAAAQFTFNEDGEKILIVTPKSDFRSHNANFRNGAVEAPVVDEETPDASVIDGLYTHLLNTYDKLLNLYEKLLNDFELVAAI